MKTTTSLLFTLLALAGCATTDYQPYEGKSSIQEGGGGTKLIVEGIDFWANGAPPRKYSVIGVVTSEIGAGIGDEALIRSAVASEVKKRGGDAAIQIDNNSTLSGVVQASPTAFVPVSTKTMRFSVIKYVQ